MITDALWRVAGALAAFGEWLAAMAWSLTSIVAIRLPHRGPQPR
jgi:hypothetical protein